MHPLHQLTTVPEDRPPAADRGIVGQPRVVRMLVNLDSILVEGETLQAWAIQRRLFALTGRRALVAVSSGRLIVMLRRLLGGFDLMDFHFQDLRDVKIGVGLFGASLSFIVGKRSDLAVASSDGHLFICSGLRKQQAREVYRLCQAQEQAWREKRRIRQLEEMRARSGAVRISASGDAFAAATPGQSESDPVQRIQTARQMLETRLISDAEFETIKARIVNRL